MYRTRKEDSCLDTTVAAPGHHPLVSDYCLIMTNDQ
ncbi:unnamed protein product [Brugia pahangi]|uniref:Uncharacterized protein n=1 Tax=Brugia pahangi TaxID=6280 RepID=A0A0N4TF71_BRUPA|nr:unnamed protein product [Brugia pahangi]